MPRLIRNLILLGVAMLAVPIGLFRSLGTRGAGVTGAPGDNLPPLRNKGWAFRIATWLVLAALGGFLVVAAGIVPIKASSGHWAITAWFLNFAMRRSVVTHSLMIEAPPVLHDEGLVAKGAGHYDFGCRPCHGSPDSPAQPRIALAMTPHPPNLSRQVPQWNARELFYIVKHGVKFTGMPAWPAPQRDDEVWAVVAFLLRLPRLTAEEYRKLVSGVTKSGAPLDDLSDTEKAPRAVVESCARCHGQDGAGRGLGVFPVLAGQRPNYLFASLVAYARGERHSGIMQPVAAGLTQETMAELARYYARLNGFGRGISNPKSPIRNPKSAEAIERGREIAMRGVPRRGIPPCAACHGPGATPRNPIYPQLAGQYSEYLMLQLNLFKQDHRGGTPYGHLMRTVAARLTPEQIRDVALYYAASSSEER